MSLDCDDEILQDFIIEAGEILEPLSKQLIQLEKTPADVDLLNTIFRGFHTIKGGAGFLSLQNLVNICHAAENVFDLLRKGKRTVDAQLMDSMLKTADAVNNIFAAVKAGQNPEPAEKSLLDSLESLAKVEKINIQTVVKADNVPTDDKVSDLITEDEFEKLLDSLHSLRATITPVIASSKPIATNEITEQDFDKLLDDLASKAEEKETCKVNVKPNNEPQIAVITQSYVDTEAAPKNDSRKAPTFVETTVRVDTNRLDQIMNMVGELVLVRNRLVKLKNDSNNEDIIKTVGTLDLVTADLQSAVMKTRMQPVKKVFSKYSRVVRDLARTLQKEINLEIIGEDTDLDKNLVEALADPLIHLVRNSVDHGIERPEVRIKAGKPRVGKLVFSATQAGDHIILSIEDDGKGMDPEELRRLAVIKGVISQEDANRLNSNECLDLIFIPGFSTNTEVSNISGRGVGMDVVKTKITQLNGSVEITSEKGRGTKINITVPLTLAILPTLMIVVGEQPFALPLASVNEIFDLDEVKTNMVDGQLVVLIRDKAIPLFYLRDWLLNDKTLPGVEVLQHIVIVSVGTQKIGFVVDKLLGQEEVVIKALSGMLHGTAGIAGATISGDGNIAMILDVPSLIKKYAHRARKGEK